MNGPDRIHGDLADRAQVIEEEERDAALAQHATRPRELPLMLNGVRCCRDCREIIPRWRLNAVPEAVRCLDCQRVHERRH